MTSRQPRRSRSTAGSGEGAAPARQAAARRVLDEMFDWNEMAKREAESATVRTIIVTKKNREIPVDYLNDLPKRPVELDAVDITGVEHVGVEIRPARPADSPQLGMNPQLGEPRWIAEGPKNSLETDQLA